MDVYWLIVPYALTLYAWVKLDKVSFLWENVWVDVFPNFPYTADDRYQSIATRLMGDGSRGPAASRGESGLPEPNLEDDAPAGADKQ